MKIPHSPNTHVITPAHILVCLFCLFVAKHMVNIGLYNIIYKRYCPHHFSLRGSYHLFPTALKLSSLCL